MLSIKSDCCNEIVIKKSKFITFLYRVDDVDCVKKYLDFINAKYSDSTHICYAYIIDGVKRFNDDGEPSKTAGMPILNVLENNKLDHILCIVVRYFGGIKLGANGLIRAYSGSCSEAINKCDIITLDLGYEVSISFVYDKTKTIDNIISNCVITYKTYDSNVNYTFRISTSDYNSIYNELVNNCIDVCKIKDCYIEKND